MKIKRSLNSSNFLIAFYMLALTIIQSIPAIAETIVIEDIKAQQEPTVTNVAPGKASLISFKNGQKLSFIMLPDQSQNIYNANAPIESGKADSVYLRQIKRLDIPGTTINDNPNLIIETVDAEGNKNEYEFVINNKASERDMIKIVAVKPEPIQETKVKPEVINTITTFYGEATPEDVQLGLEVSIAKDRIEAGDPLAILIREYIAKTSNGVSTKDALQETKIPISVIQRLGSLGQEEDTRRRLLPLNSDLN